MAGIEKFVVLHNQSQNTQETPGTERENGTDEMGLVSSGPVVRCAAGLGGSMN